MPRALVSLLLLGAVAGADEARDRKWKEFRNQEVRGHWDNMDTPLGRVLIIRNFKGHDHPEAAAWLMRAAVNKDPSGHVIREAIKILRGYRREATFQAMAGAYRKNFKHWERRGLGLMAFTTCRHDIAVEVIKKGFREKKPGTLAAACRAAGLRNHPEFKPLLRKALKHKDMHVRVGAIEALRRMRSEEDVPLLFKTFCQDPSNRVRYEALEAIKKLTLKDHGFHPADWKEWYLKQIAEEQVPEGGKNPWGTRFPIEKGEAPNPGWFFHIPVIGDRVCFVIDTSGDMDNAWKVDVAAERKKKGPERMPNFFSVKTRWQLMTAQLKRCLDGMPATTEVAFVFYYNKMQPWPEDRKKFLRNTPKMRTTLFKHLEEKIKRSGTTDMGGALETAWGFLKEGNLEANFAKGCDTIVFTTDGVPTAGTMRNKPEEVRDAAWRTSVTRRLQIHTVGLYNHAFELFQDLAKDNDGLYIHAQEPNDTSEPQDLDFWPEKKKAFEAAKKKKKRG